MARVGRVSIVLKAPEDTKLLMQTITTRLRLTATRLSVDERHAHNIFRQCCGDTFHARTEQ